MTWQQKFDEDWELDRADEFTSINQNMKEYIRTEIIKKIIADLPDAGNIPETDEYANGWNAHSKEYRRIKQKLKDKWL
ncbi:MAG TPA: hypothetical protein VF571_09135 [Pyrinomonadaceae bacterium]|jgi:hypothetical protein